MVGERLKIVRKDAIRTCKSGEVDHDVDWIGDLELSRQTPHLITVAFPTLYVIIFLNVS